MLIGEQYLLSLCVWGSSIYLFLLPSLTRYFLSIYYVLDTILGTGDIARDSAEEDPEFPEFPTNN